MKRFYLTGQRTFGNRGCEAIVRSTVSQLRKQFGAITVFIPSDNIELDKKQWPDHQEHGVIFVPLYYPKLTRYWVQIQRLPFSFIKQMDWPFPPNKELKDTLASVDAVLSIGGDMYTYEGRLPAWIMGIDQIAMKLGKPVVLWGATVGDFSKEPRFLPKLKQHFMDMSLKIVRESISEKVLLEKFESNNVLRMPDIAFTLSTKKVDLDEFWPASSENGVLGLNVSPLIERFAGETDKVSSQIITFIREVVDKKGMSVLLVPHVTPLDGNPKNNDYEYMNNILDDLSVSGGKVKIMNPVLNAVETKYVISRCRYFIGARTHATIAALSSKVPTISIAYSEKAKGINADIFGDEPVVVGLRDLTADKLFNALDYLEKNESRLKSLLDKKIEIVVKEIDNAVSEFQTRVFN
ncbi:MAG: polysaccharide pyruvyl transferase family protein [Desulfurivibrionaceae bacterium]